MCMFLKRYHKNADDAVLQVNCGIDFTREAVLLCHDQVDVSVELRVGEHNFGQIDYFAQLVEGPSAKCLPKVLVIVNDHVNPEEKKILQYKFTILFGGLVVQGGRRKFDIGGADSNL